MSTHTWTKLTHRVPLIICLLIANVLFTNGRGQSARVRAVFSVLLTINTYLRSRFTLFVSKYACLAALSHLCRSASRISKRATKRFNLIMHSNYGNNSHLLF